MKLVKVIKSKGLVGLMIKYTNKKEIIDIYSAREVPGKSIFVITDDSNLLNLLGYIYATSTESNTYDDLLKLYWKINSSGLHTAIVGDYIDCEFSLTMQEIKQPYLYSGESYHQLKRKIACQHTEAQTELQWRLENLQKLDIRGPNGKQLCFIMTNAIKTIIGDIEDLYKELSPNTNRVVEEIYYSCILEGAITMLDRAREIIYGFQPENNSEYIILGLKNAINYIENIKPGMYFTKETLEQLWSLITVQPEQSDTDENDCNVYQEFIKFLHENDSDLHPLIKASVLNYYLVCMQPFPNENGILARLISTDFLRRSGYDKVRYLPFSQEIYENLHHYYLAIKNSDNEYNDITFFVEFFLHITQYTLEDVIYLHS